MEYSPIFIRKRCLHQPLIEFMFLFLMSMPLTGFTLSQNCPITFPRGEYLATAIDQSLFFAVATPTYRVFFQTTWVREREFYTNFRER